MPSQPWLCGRVPTVVAVKQRSIWHAPIRSATNLRAATVEAELAAAQRVAPQPLGQVTEKGEAAKFDWFRQWYPLMVVEDADPNIPHATQLLGMNLVLWRDKAGQWRCFEDRCPHRLAALSEGRIDEKSGDLMCNYHGWRFDGAGKCTAIPQLSTEQQANPQVLRSQRACAVAFPTKVAEGLVWVWASGGPQAEQEAAAAEWRGMAPSLDTMGNAAFGSSSRWYYRDIPAGYVANKENSFNDPSHDTVLHHGTAGGFLNRARAQPLKATVTEMGPTGYSVELISPFGKTIDTARFPCGSRRASPWIHGVAYSVPAAEGRTHFFVTFLKPAPSEATPATSASSSSSSSAAAKQQPSTPAVGKPKFGLKAAIDFAKFRIEDALKTRWANHLGVHLLVDADNAVQYSVDRNRALAGKEGGAKVYLPAEADRGPAACWTWLEKFGGGGPPVSTLVRPIDPDAPLVPRRLLLDRYHQHTKNCKDCSSAHAMFSRLAGVALPLAAALAVAATASLASHGLSVACGLMVAGAAAMAAAHARCKHMVAQFEFVDYDHHHISKQA